MAARKVMLLGEIGVGKTSLIRRLVLDSFEAAYKPTIGVDLYRYASDVKDASGAPLELVVWDTDGNFGESMFQHVYIKGASAALVVGDVTRRATLASAVKLVQGFEEAAPGRPVVLVINKLDLIEGAAAAEAAHDLDAVAQTRVMTSALTGSNVKEAFSAVAAAIVRRGL